MWSLFSGIFSSIKDKATSKSSVLVLGIDGAGKTTLVEAILQRVIPSRKPKTIRPTNGQNTDTVTDGKTYIRFWDIGGDRHLRSIWKDYLKEATALIYVVNGSQSERIHESRKLFDEVYMNFHGKISVVFFNCDQGILDVFPSAIRGQLFFIGLSNGEHIDLLYQWIKGTAVK
jgi:small GTP-binding protein